MVTPTRKDLAVFTGALRLMCDYQFDCDRQRTDVDSLRVGFPWDRHRAAGRGVLRDEKLVTPVRSHHAELKAHLCPSVGHPAWNPFSRLASAATKSAPSRGALAQWPAAGVRTRATTSFTRDDRIEPWAIQRRNARVWSANAARSDGQSHISQPLALIFRHR